MKLSCTQCGSENVKKLSVVYSEGMQSVNLTSAGAFSGGGVPFAGAGVGGAKTWGEMQSFLSEKAAPPQKLPYVRLWPFMFYQLFFGALVGLFNEFVYAIPRNNISMTLLVLLFLVYPVYKGYKAHQFNTKDWPVCFEIWQHSFHCSRCDTTFLEPVRLAPIYQWAEKIGSSVLKNVVGAEHLRAGGAGSNGSQGTSAPARH